jgi:hypothetical protein
MESNVGKWDEWYKGTSTSDMGAFRYGDTETYRLAAAFLADMEEVEDWGCGLGGFKRFCLTKYIGVDGSKTPIADKIVDLCKYRSSVDGIMMRHVLEHNPDWRLILEGAVASCRKKLCLILFTTFSETTRQIADNKQFGVDVPDISFSKTDIESFLSGHKFKQVSLRTPTQYGIEHVYFVMKKPVKVIRSGQPAHVG